MTRNIVAIGGGDVGGGSTFSIDRRFLALADVAFPKLLFVPTASGDSEEYADAIRRTYQDRLGCEVEVLRLHSEDRWLPTIVSKIEAADLIYVGGGNTKMMLEKWRELGVDRELKRVVAKGKPVGGLSAGALCWFRVGNSDWPQYENVPDVLTARLDCLGLVDLVLCPHTKNEQFRLSEFKRMMEGETGVGIGLDDCCAIQIRGDEYRFIASQEGSVAHRLYAKDGKIAQEMIQPHDDFRPLTEVSSVHNE